MDGGALSRSEFNRVVAELKAEIGESCQAIDFPRAYDGYLQLVRIFGAVDLTVTNRGDRRRVEMVPQL